MDESILSFLKSVNLPDCRIQNTPHWIFLCGGTTGKSGRYRSARDYFLRYVKAEDAALLKRVRLAETINDWFDLAVFDDLLELEVILADCSDLTLLFVESPGSIAELGAFAASDQLRPRTLAVVNTTFKQERTFISDGPVRRIKTADADLVRYWEWNPKRINHPDTLAELKRMSNELVALLNEKSKSASREQVLIRESPGHTMFLIADLIDIVGITFSGEIVECLAEWGFKLDRKTLQRYLLVLERLHLIKKTLRSNQVYYLSRLQTPLIRHAFLSSAKVRDRDRLKTLIRGSLNQSDERRMAVYRFDLRDQSRRSR